jgi:GcrA cell cycle regulator
MSWVWTNENVEILKRLVEDGLSSGQISRRIGNQFSRNAIIGKCHRVGFQLRGKPVATVRNPKAPKPKAIKMAPVLARKRVDSALPGTGFRAADQIIVAPEMRQLTIVELRPTTCRWPLGDPRTPDFRYCGAGGASMTGGHPYCPYHHSLSYETRQQRAARAQMAIQRGRFGAAF